MKSLSWLKHIICIKSFYILINHSGWLISYSSSQHFILIQPPFSSTQPARQYKLSLQRNFRWRSKHHPFSPTTHKRTPKKPFGESKKKNPKLSYSSKTPKQYDLRRRMVANVLQLLQSKQSSRFDHAMAISAGFFLAALRHFVKKCIILCVKVAISFMIHKFVSIKSSHPSCWLFKSVSW